MSPSEYTIVVICCFYSSVLCKHILESLYRDHFQNALTSNHVRTGSAVDCKQNLRSQPCMCGPGYVSGEKTASDCEGFHCERKKNGETICNLLLCVKLMAFAFHKSVS